METKKNSQQGFSLVEMALVVLMIGLVLGGMVRFMNIERQFAIEQEETQSLERIKEALVGFAMLHGRLPCPDTNDDGLAEKRSACGRAEVGSANLSTPDYNQQRRVAVGQLPYIDLGMPRDNVYGHPYQYVVTLHYADFENYQTARFRDPTPFPYSPDGQKPKVNTRCENAFPDDLRATFTLCSKGGVKVTQKNEKGIASVVEEHAPFAVISLGKEGEEGADALAPYNLKYKRQGRNNDLNTNSSNPADTAFRNNRKVLISDASNREFDHKVVWMSPPALAVKMVKIGLDMW